MDFAAFDSDAYAAHAEAKWGDTPEYQAYAAKKLTHKQQETAGAGLMELFKGFAACKDGAPDAPEARAAVKSLQAYITEHFYPCSDEVLLGLGKLYGAGGEFTENIDRAGGEGTAVFVKNAIEYRCNQK